MSRRSQLLRLTPWHPWRYLLLFTSDRSFLRCNFLHNFHMSVARYHPHPETSLYCTFLGEQGCTMHIGMFELLFTQTNSHQICLMLSKLWLIEPTFWPQRFPNVISNLISLLTLSISPFNNFPPAFDFETLYFIFTMLLWWQFDKIFSINWITLKVDLKKKMCQPKKIGLSLSKNVSSSL